MQVMATILTKSSIELVTQLIRKEFNEIDLSTEYIHGKGKRLIKLARELGLNSLADELQDDLNSL